MKVYLTVSDFDACLPFYENLLEFFEMQCLVKTDALCYCVAGRTGFGIRWAAARHQETPLTHGDPGPTTFASEPGAAST